MAGGRAWRAGGGRGGGRRKQGVHVGFLIECFGTVQYDYAKRHGLATLAPTRPDPGQEVYRFETEDVLVAGDVTIRFFWFEDPALGPNPTADLLPGARAVKSGPGVAGKELCFVSFHTSFHPGDIYLTTPEARAPRRPPRSSLAPWRSTP